jgi:hypothetical protein
MLIRGSVLTKKEGTIEIGDATPSHLIDLRYCESRLFGQVSKNLTRHEIPPVWIVAEIASWISRVVRTVNKGVTTGPHNTKRLFHVALDDLQIKMDKRIKAIK